MIRAQNVSRFFGPKKVFSDIDFEAHIGEAIEICGDNGSGKTTFLKTLAGLLLPTTGSVVISNLDTKYDFIKTKNLISYVGVNDGGFFSRLTGQENLSLLGEFYGLDDLALKTKLDQISRQINLEKILATPFNEMSTGMKQLLRVTLALVSARSLFLFDEPLRSLDKKTRLGLMNILLETRQNHLLIFTNHMDQEWQALKPKTLKLANGRLQ